MKRITLEELNPEIQHKVTIEMDAVTIDEVLNGVYNVIIAFGFHPDSVKRGIIELAEDLDNTNE